MTANQINYAKLVEERRHNTVSEGQTGEANYINARNAETNRMNALTNQYSANIRAAELAEEARSNRANELLVAQRQEETKRYQEESNRIEHEKAYNQRVANQIEQQKVDNQLTLGMYQADISDRANQVRESAGIAGNIINGMTSILRLATVFAK